MSELVITVQGRSSRRVPAERGTVRFTAHGDGAARESVMAFVVVASAAVRSLIDGCGDAVESTSSDSVRSWSELPWTADGQRTEPVFHAEVELRAVLSDVDMLARLVDDASVVPGVSVQGVEWTLTDRTRDALTDEIRYGAVADAASKARAYASAVGSTDVSPVAIADAGMLDGSAPPTGGVPIGVMRAMAAPSDSSGLALSPQPIEIEAVVDARFISR